MRKKWRNYRGFDLHFCEAYQGKISPEWHKVVVECSYWLIARDGKRVDSALTLPRAMARVQALLEANSHAK